MPDISPQSCLTCRKVFTPQKTNQKYCSIPCRKATQNHRRRTRLATAALTQFSKEKLLSSATYLRDVAGLPRLVHTDWMSLQARVCEAEEQIKRWTHLRNHREAKLAEASAENPGLHVTMRLLTGKTALTIPPEAIQIGVACTESSLAVVVFGRPRKQEEG